MHHSRSARSPRAAAPRLRRALLLASLALGGCQIFLSDPRPWLSNDTSVPVEVESVHSDGHSLRVRLYPGTSFALGATGQPIQEIVVRQQSEVVLRVSQADLRSCLALSARVCRGWSLQPDGVATLGPR